VVEFIDGTYGVRDRFQNRFLDMNKPRYWWPKESGWFYGCKTDLDTAMQHHERLTQGLEDPIKRIVK